LNFLFYLKILVCDNYEKHDGTTLKNVYLESHLQLNFHTGSEPETLVIRTLEKQKPNQLQTDELVRIIEMNSIRSIMYVNIQKIDLKKKKIFFLL